MIFNTQSKYYFFDLIEKTFLWETNFCCHNKWAGIIHCTQETPEYLNIVNIRYLFKNANFINSLNNCLCIISLSEYVAKFLKEEFAKINKVLRFNSFIALIKFIEAIIFRFDFCFVVLRSEKEGFSDAKCTIKFGLILVSSFFIFSLSIKLTL